MHLVKYRFFDILNRRRVIAGYISRFLNKHLKLDSMQLSIRKVYFVLFLENMKYFGAINENASKDSLYTCAEAQAIHHRIKTIMFPIQLFPTECLFGGNGTIFSCELPNEITPNL